MDQNGCFEPYQGSSHPPFGRGRAEGEEDLMGNWTMKKDCELIKLARSKLSRDQIVRKLNVTPVTLHKVAKRLASNFVAT